MTGQPGEEMKPEVLSMTQRLLEQDHKNQWGRDRFGWKGLEGEKAKDIAAFICAEIDKETERCAKVAEELIPKYKNLVNDTEREITDGILMSWGKEIAATIRQRRAG